MQPRLASYSTVAVSPWISNNGLIILFLLACLGFTVPTQAFINPPIATDTPGPTDTPAPTDTPVPTDTPIPTPTGTTTPTSTLSPTSTSSFTNTPTRTRTRTKTPTKTFAISDVKSIRFITDHGTYQQNLLLDNNANWLGSGNPYTQPEWNVPTTVPTNNPISQTKGTQLRANVKLKVVPGGLSFKIHGDGPDNYVDFYGQDESTGNDQEVYVYASSITPTPAPLPNAVCILEKSINWTVTIESPNYTKNIGTTGPHKIYVTWGTPQANGVTDFRINHTCSWANSAQTEVTVADGIYSYLGDNDPPYEPEEERETVGYGWSLMEGTTFGACNQQAELMREAVKMQGISDATVILVKASSNSGAGNCLDQESKTEDEIKKWLIMDFDGGAGYKWNAFEGCCVTAGFYYAVWPKHKAVDDYNMLKYQLAPQQYWVKTYFNIEPPTGGWCVKQVFNSQALP